MPGTLHEEPPVKNRVVCPFCHKYFVVSPENEESTRLKCVHCGKIFIPSYIRYFTREWIEPLCVALVFALLIKRTLMEIYVIPTSSMEPTLHGAKNYPKDGGDKVLVDKTAYWRSEPKRWDVIVFLAPKEALDGGSRKYFIKRLIGLPGETVTIKNGDIYINGKIARKPPDVLNTLLYPVYKSKKDGWQDRWIYSKEWKVEKDALVFSSHSYGTAVYGADITDYIESDKNIYDYDTKVGDIRVVCSIVPKKKKGSFSIEIYENSAHYTAELFFKTDKAVIEKNGKIHQNMKFYSEIDRKIDIIFDNIDGMITLNINGNKVNWEDPEGLIWEKTIDSGVVLRGENTHFKIINCNILRDIYYTLPGEYKVPKDGYFVLGDNSSKSRDSRYWGKVPKENLVGKAIYVVWPVRLWPFKGTPPWPFASRTRIKKIR